ncbi:MAG: hypothetical protein WD425_13305 [Nitrospirales bacterium]
MAYIQSELEKAVKLVKPRPVGDAKGQSEWFEEMEKALLPLRYLYEQNLDGEVSQVAITGYLDVFLQHADNLLTDAWRQGWTNHPRKQEG